MKKKIICNLKDLENINFDDFKDTIFIIDEPFETKGRPSFIVSVFINNLIKNNKNVKRLNEI